VDTATCKQSESEDVHAKFAIKRISTPRATESEESMLEIYGNQDRWEPYYEYKEGWYCPLTENDIDTKKDE
jgi:hypothetical protein